MNVTRQRTIEALRICRNLGIKDSRLIWNKMMKREKIEDSFCFQQSPWM